MKVVILAGGVGSRLEEETQVKPKPMVEVGGRPILWHIMKIYSHHGFDEFIIALGYKGGLIKQYFVDYHHLSSDLSVSVTDGEVSVHDGEREDWVVHLVDTGQKAETGERIRRLADWIGDETFMLTYGDGVADIDLRRLVEFHRSEGRLATLTAVRPTARFGAIELDASRVVSFREKPQIAHGWINGGFFVLEPEVLDYIPEGNVPWEHEPLEALAADGQLSAYEHTAFWQCMDTLRDLRLLEERWETGQAPWEVWR